MDHTNDTPDLPTTQTDDRSIVEMYNAHVQSGDPSIQSVLNYSNGSDRNLSILMSLIGPTGLSPNPERKSMLIERAPNNHRKRELQAQVLLRLRLWIDYKTKFLKQYKKKFSKKKKQKRFNENELVVRDITRLLSLAAFQLSPQEPFDAFLRSTLNEIPGNFSQKEQIFHVFEVSPLAMKKDKVHLEEPLSVSEKQLFDESQKPMAKRKRASSKIHYSKSSEAPTTQSRAKNPSGIDLPTRMEVTVPIRRNSLTEKTRFVGSHFNLGNVDSLFRHVKSAIPTGRPMESQPRKTGKEKHPPTTQKPTPTFDAIKEVQNQVLEERKESESKGIFQASEKPSRRRSNLVADALRALRRRDKK